VPAVVLSAPARLRERLAPLGDRRILMSGLTTVLTFAALYTTCTYIALVVEPATGGDAGLLAVLLWVSGVAGVLGNIAAGHLTDRKGARPVVLAGLAGVGVVQAILLLPVSMTVAVVWAIGSGISWLVVVGQQHRIVSLAPQNAPVVLGLNGSALYLGSAVGSAVGGLALSIGGAGAVVATAVGLAALAAAFTVATFRRPAPALLAATA